MNPLTFKSLEYWLHEFHQKQDRTNDLSFFQFVLFGNKSDLVEEEVITRE